VKTGTMGDAMDALKKIRNDDTAALPRCKAS
jgi:Lon-like protease